MIGDRAIVDFVKTYGKGIFLGVEPKRTRKDANDPKSEQVQATDKETGLLKWTVTVAVKSLLSANAKLENMAVTINSREQPFGAISVGSYVVVENLEMGIIRQDRGGYSTFFSAETIRQVAPERVASNQSPQPARVGAAQ